MDSDKAHFFFQKMEKEHGSWKPGAFKYPDGSIAAPAAGKAAPSGGGKAGNAGSTRPASPVNGAATS